MAQPAQLAPRVPARVVLVSIAGLWFCYFILTSLRGWAIGFSFDWPMVSRRLEVVLASMAVTALLWPLLRLLDRHALWVRICAVLVAALPASLLLAQVNQWIFADIQTMQVSRIGEQHGITIRRDEAGNVLVELPDPPKPPDPPRPPEPSKTAGASVAPDPPKVPVSAGLAPVDGKEAGDSRTHVLLDAQAEMDNRWRQLTDLASSRYFLLLAWAAIYLALANAEHARAAERREGEYRRAAKASELRSLRYQVNPHFLFNTLNSLSALVMTGKGEAAERMIQTLSTFYRRSLSEDPTSDHPLAAEIEMQKLYLEIEGVRFPDRLRTRFDIPAGLESARVPGLILQPLVENSVKYAVAQSRLPVTVTISAREEAGRLLIEVSDDGPGMEADAGSDRPQGAGIGLANVCERLEAKFGASASVETGALERGYRTVIGLPLVRGHD
ncbi:MAG: sensor histidine kinase [Novosphingobium sp.]